MEEWIRQTLNSDQAGFAVLTAVFISGILSIFTCACNYSVIGIVAGYSGTLGSAGRMKAVLINAVFFLCGMLISMAVIGAIIGYASELISDSFGEYWKIAAGVISIFFGMLTIDLLPFKIPGITLSPSVNNKGTLGSIIFGLTIGGLTLVCNSCCNPIFPVVLALSFVKGSFVWGIMLLLAYALGFGLTFAGIIIIAGLGFGRASKAFVKFGKVLKYAGGILMILVGFYLLITI